MAEQKRALVVDDSKSARLVLRRMLEKHALLVDTVESGKMALDFLRFNRPDIIFMDHLMPGIDGFETIEAIRQNPDSASIPVMMYTSKGGDLYQQQAKEIGAIGVLPKTVAPGELYQALLKINLVEERRKQQRTRDSETPSERAEDILQLRTTPDRVEPADMPAATPSQQARDNDFDNPLRPLLDEQRAEIRKDMLLSMESVARQTSTKLHKELEEKLALLRPPSAAKAAKHLQLALLLLAASLLLSVVWNYRLSQ